MDFFKYLTEISKTTFETKVNEPLYMAASILYNLKQQESETNSNYAAAYAFITETLGITDVNGTKIADVFDEIMSDENDHAAKFNALASQILGISEGNVNE